MKNGIFSNHCRVPRPYKRHRTSWKFSGNCNGNFGKTISPRAVHSLHQPRSVRHVVFNPRQLIPHGKHRAGKMVVRPNNVQSQCTVLAIFLLKHGSPPDSRVLRAIQSHSQITFDVRRNDHQDQNVGCGFDLGSADSSVHWSFKWLG